MGDGASANYARREKLVEAIPDALLHAVEGAQPGETIRVAAGAHLLSRELTINVALRILGPRGEDSHAILSSNGLSVLVRTRAPAQLADLTLCRLGAPSGFP